MVRINLSLEDELFDSLQKDAVTHGSTVNVYLITILEKLYTVDPFDYPGALAVLEQEAKSQPLGRDFTLADLPSFAEISVVRSVDANLKPSVVRARLGKMFNSRVRDGFVGDVRRSVDGNGALKFISRTAVYVREENVRGG